MTRINIAIPTKSLSDKHLLAEHREIVRIKHVINTKTPIPQQFTMGEGHVLFFVNKIGYVYDRYKELYNECLARGFDVTDMSSSFDGLDKTKNYTPTIGDKLKIKQRLIQKINEQSNHRYYSQPVTKEFLINKLREK